MVEENAVKRSEKAGGKVYLALLHYPVYNRNREVVITALTNLDVHDIARAAKTYGVEKFYVITPAKSQQRLLKRILDHWISGVGGEYNPERKAALELVDVASSLEDLIVDLTVEERRKPLVIFTSAKMGKNAISFARLKEKYKKGADLLLVFGTGWGLAEEIFEQGDFLLEPIRGIGEYNHLAVRSAVAIILDRLFGR